VGGKGEGGGRGEKWPKPCMHIWIIKEKKEIFSIDWSIKLNYSIQLWNFKKKCKNGKKNAENSTKGNYVMIKCSIKYTYTLKEINSIIWSANILIKKHYKGHAGWCTLIISATQAAKVGGLRLEVNPCNITLRPYLKNELKAKELGYGLSGRAFAY
jgi:hypothetical protein